MILIDYEKLVKRYRNLPQYKDKSDEELLELLKKKKGPLEKLFPSDIITYLNEEEQKIKEQISSDVSIDHFLFLLGYTNLLQRELKELKEKEPKTPEEKKLRLRRLNDIEEQIRKNTSEIRDWRKQLGLDRISDSDSPTQVFEKTMKEAEEFIKAHKNEYTWKCPACGSINVLGLRHWALDDEYQVWNDDLYQLVEEGKITLQEMAKVLRTSEEALKKVLAEKKK